eukprot:6485787-Amphidinium_carterae.1
MQQRSTRPIMLSRWGGALTAVKNNGLALLFVPEVLKRDHDIALAAVTHNGLALEYVPEELKTFALVMAAVSSHGYCGGGSALRYATEEQKADRNIVWAAVTSTGLALEYAPAFQADLQVVMAAVQSWGYAIRYAADELKSNRAVVLAAVRREGCALKLVPSWRNDREIVLAAVKSNGHALEMASGELKADPAIVLAAIQQESYQPILEHAADELILDSTFAEEAKKKFHILKISMISGRSTAVLSRGFDRSTAIIEKCCKRLQIQRRGTEKLIHNTLVLWSTDKVGTWPGIRPHGEVSEYQLILT